MNKKQMFNEVLDKVISRAQSWNAKILSQASTITLVKSFLASIPTYTSATFYLSKNICSKIDVLRNLLGVTLRTRILFSQCPGPRFVSPKIVGGGGLGIRKLEDTNIALLAKLGLAMASNLDVKWVQNPQSQIPLEKRFPQTTIDLSLSPPGYGKASTSLKL